MKYLNYTLVIFGLSSTLLFAHEPIIQNHHQIYSDVQKRMEAESLHFRELVVEDFKKGFSETLAALKPIDLPEGAIDEVLKERTLQGVRSYILEKEGRVVATASMILETKFYHNGSKVAHIEDVAVNPELQKQGLGKMIMVCLMELAIKEGCYKIILDCNEKNVPFYENIGFRRHELQMRIDLN